MHAWWTHALVMYIINTCTSYVYNKHAWAHALVMYIINMHEHMQHMHIVMYIINMHEHMH